MTKGNFCFEAIMKETILAYYFYWVWKNENQSLFHETA